MPKTPEQLPYRPDCDPASSLLATPEGGVRDYVANAVGSQTPPTYEDALDGSRMAAR